MLPISRIGQGTDSPCATSKASFPPVGDYNPDWAIAFDSGKVKHVYFIAETKGSMSSLQLREIEKARIACARKFFAKLTSKRMRYDGVDGYGTLMQIVL